MAHSPSPGPSSFSTSLLNQRHLSTSPPLSQQPLSKRDKRRTMIDQRLKDIATSFASNRDLHLRTQLNSLSRDMHFVTKADPYENRLLDDGADELSTDLSSVVGLSSMDGDNRVPLGKYTAKFVEDVNNEMEQRDAHLTDVDISYKRQLARLQLEYDFAVQVADAEHQALKEAARHRVTTSIQAKKKLIQKEKDQLDTADSSFLMNSHALTTTITQPGSPGGLHANRKTRHTRHHRQDPDNLEGGEPSKRKRKIPADVDSESPGASVKGASIDTLGNLLWDKGKTSSDQDHPQSTLSVDQFFGARELISHNKSAHTTVAQSWSDKRFKRQNNLIKNGQCFTESGNGDMSDIERKPISDEEEEPVDPSSLVAPAMDRTGSHATRSTRLNQLEVIPRRDSIDSMDDPKRLYGLAIIDAQQAKIKAAPSKDVEAPLTVGMSPQSIAEDLSILQSLMDED